MLLRPTCIFKLFCRVTKIFWSAINPKNRCKYTCEVHSLNNTPENLIKSDAEVPKDENMTFCHDGAEWQQLKQKLECSCKTNLNDEIAESLNTQINKESLHTENCFVKNNFKFCVHEELLTFLKKTYNLAQAELYTHKDHNFYSIVQPEPEKEQVSNEQSIEYTTELKPYKHPDLYLEKNAYEQKHISVNYIQHPSDFTSDLSSCSSSSTLSATSPNDICDCQESKDKLGVLSPALKNCIFEPSEHLSIQKQSLTRQISNEIERRLHQRLSFTNDNSFVEGLNSLSNFKNLSCLSKNNSNDSPVSPELHPHLKTNELNFNRSSLDLTNLNEYSCDTSVDLFISEVSSCESFLNSEMTTCNFPNSMKLYNKRHDQVFYNSAKQRKPIEFQNPVHMFPSVGLSQEETELSLQTHEALLCRLREYIQAHPGMVNYTDKNSINKDVPVINLSSKHDDLCCYSVNLPEELWGELVHAGIKNSEIQKILNVNKNCLGKNFKYPQSCFPVSSEIAPEINTDTTVFDTQHQSLISAHRTFNSCSLHNTTPFPNQQNNENFINMGKINKNPSSLQRNKLKKRIKMADNEISPKKRLLSKYFTNHNDRLVDNPINFDYDMQIEPKNFDHEIVVDNDTIVSEYNCILNTDISDDYTEIKLKKGKTSVEQKEPKKIARRDYSEVLNKLLNNSECEKVKKSETQLVFILKNDEGWFRENNSLEGSFSLKIN